MFARLKVFPPVLAALALMVLLLFPAGAAQAEPPVTIPGGTYIVDNANVLGNQKAEVQNAITKLSKDHGVTLFVVYVDSFDGQAQETWANTVATEKNMGQFDALLAVAVQTKQYAFVGGSNTFLSAAQGSTIQSSAIKPQLSAGNWAQAAIDTAAALGDAAGGGKGNVPNPTGGFVTLGVGGVVVVGGAGTALYLRNKRKKGAAEATAKGYGPDGKPLDPNAGMTIPELRAKAGSLLIAADDAIKTSEHEIGFAQASYGDEAVKQFQAALSSAKTHLSESFKLQQQLDDEIPDTIEEQRSWLGEIIKRSEDANAALDAEKAAFDELRELERTAPQVLASIRSQAAEAKTSVATAEQKLAGMTAQYSDAALAPVRDNIAEAKERLDFVDTAAAEADSKLGASDTAGAAVAVKAAEESLLQSTVLLDAIASTEATFHDAAQTLQTALPSALTDLQQAKSMVASSQFARYAPTVAAAESTLNDVRMNAASGKPDPVALLAAVQDAHSQLDELLTGIRDQQQQALRAQAALQQAFAGAQANIATAKDFIAARRGGVGSAARTRLSEAERNFDYAVNIADSDPTNALTYAQQAQELAKQAIQYAQNDVDSFGGGGGYGGGGRSSMGGGMGGAILGGIIGGLLSGGGGGGFGGGGFGGGGGGGFGGGGGGGGGGGFGGGGGNF
ncbi:peptidase [Arthrobacter alpinus]|uniref:Peptidase n=1 Tax=Arthrobacter alpinus TaxID=656366 RepID=A0A0S2LYA5_9MICC|nr:TPM domain-containing protein [Arthrobacter alpinus]ALO66264.1 peptidase [Arthrobacter alpinus]